MKRYLLLFLTALLSLPICGAQDKDAYRIARMNSETIRIEGRECKVGSTFYADERIAWEKPGQFIYAENTRTAELHIFSREAFSSKGVSTIQDYFVTRKLSTRSAAASNCNSPNPINTVPGQDRIALVVGNSNYETLPCLANAVNDASLVSRKLLEMGFITYTAYDCTGREMDSQLADFVKKAQNYDVVLFYYAGHGVTHDNYPYFLPVDADLGKESAPEGYLNGKELMQKLSEVRGKQMALVFLDACRNALSGEDASERVTMEAEPNMAIIYSTHNGKLALDGEGGNSPFAEAFIENAGEEGVSISDMLIDMGKGLAGKTNDYQVPSVSSSFTSRFYLVPARTASDKLSRDAAAGDLRAMTALAKKYYAGDGIAKDPAAAFEWFCKAAEAGDAAAQLSLGQMYYEGSVPSGEPDYRNAMKWWSAAAGNRHPYADYYIATHIRDLAPWYDYTRDSEGYLIPPGMRTQDPALIFLILHSRSVYGTSKQEWFDMYPSMSESQIDRLYQLLLGESSSLLEIEKKLGRSGEE